MAPFPSRTVAIVGSLVLLAAVTAWVLWPASSATNDGAETPDWTSEKRSDATETRMPIPREGEDEIEQFVVLSPRAAGLRGWKPVTKAAKDGGEFLSPGGVSDARTLADRLPAVVYIESGGLGGKRVRGGLSGLILPEDSDAISTMFLSERVHVDGADAVPPAAQMRGIAGLAALAVQLVAVESDPAAAAGLLGQGEVLAGHRASLETAAAAWPERARVWRVLAVPAGIDNSQRLEIDYAHDPERFESDVRLARASGLLSFTLVDDGALLAGTDMRYQNAQQQDRALDVDFLYDRDSDSWALLKIRSRPSSEDMIRLGKEGKFDEVHASIFELDFTTVLPDCLITTRGLIRHDQ